MNVGLRVPPCVPLPLLGEFAREVENRGYASIWLPDSHLLWRDVFVSAASVIMATQNITIGTAVTNLVTRHPSVVASSARTLFELDPGRFRLGVGVGNSAVEPIGLSPSRRSDFENGLNTLRALARGESVKFGESESRLRDPVGLIPLYVAASGPNNLRMAGRMGDGAILLAGVSEAAITASMQRIQEGIVERSAEVSPAPDEPIDIVVSTFCHVTDTPLADAALLKPICLTIAYKGGYAALLEAGIDIALPNSLPSVYPDLIHAEDWDEAVEASSQFVSDEDAARFAETFCLFGNRKYIASRLDQISSLGVNEVFLQHVGSYSLPDELVNDLGDIPRQPYE